MEVKDLSRLNNYLKILSMNGHVGILYKMDSFYLQK